MIVLGLFVLALLCYLIGKVAYNEGRRSKWEEMRREYIVLHKSVIIQENKTSQKKKLKHLTKKK